ncbi:hypothetical protein Q8A67_002109 [Cirrhinus molitorella]|uniref:Protein kinase domain-containing protein n=1 Tax=Cirrhinus molitorella TaxID=172907 RepID=A0AA88QC83_9TELE|nr:hypothetical protein Q8A67_002109 [Cirrhinus molitorella]
MGLFSRKKALNLERAHELQPCVLLKYTPITAEHHSRPLDETPGGADETRKSMRRRLLNFFRRKTGKYNLVKAEKVYQNAAESYQRLNDDHTSPQQSVEIHDLGESVSFEVLPAAEEQLEQDAFQLQDVLLGTSVSSSEDDGAEELNKDQTTSLQLSVEIHDLGEAPSFEVLPASEEQLEQDFHCLASSTDDDDEAEEPDNSHIFWRYEFGQKLGEGGFGCVHAGTRCKDGLKVVE